MNDYSRKMLKVPTYNLLREQDMGKLPVLRFPRAAALPGLKADIWGVFSRSGPESYHGEVGKIHADTVAAGTLKADAA